MLFYLLLNVADELKDIVGFCAAAVENKVCMALSYLSTTNLVAFKPCLFN